MLNQCELAGITTYAGIFLVDVWTLHTNLARGVGFWSVVETVDYADVARAAFFRQLDMIIFVAAVTPATLTIAVIEAGLGDRERQQVALPIALGFDMTVITNAPLLRQVPPPYHQPSTLFQLTYESNPLESQHFSLNYKPDKEAEDYIFHHCHPICAPQHDQ